MWCFVVICGELQFSCFCSNLHFGDFVVCCYLFLGVAGLTCVLQRTVTVEAIRSTWVNDDQSIKQADQSKKPISQSMKHTSQLKKHISQSKYHISQSMKHISQSKKHISQSKRYIDQSKETHRSIKEAHQSINGRLLKVQIPAA